MFYEDTEETVENAITNPVAYVTSFGYAGTYWDYVQEIAMAQDVKELIRLDISEEEVAEILREAGFKGYRFDGALMWIIKSIAMIKGL